APPAAAPPRRSRARPRRRRASPAPRARPTGRPAPPSSGRAGTGRRATPALAASARAGPRSAQSPLAAPREAEDALGDDVAEHLGGAGLDRVPAAAKLLMVPPAVVEDPVLPVHLARELRKALVRLRPPQLHAGPLRAGNAGALVRAEGAVVGEAESRQLDPLPRECLAHVRLGTEPGPVLLPPGVPEEPRKERVQRRREREAEGGALVQQRRHRHLPAVALVAQPVFDRHLDIGEEDLVELR